MLLPTRSIAPQRALLSVSAQIAKQLDQPATVTQTWARLQKWRTANGHHQPITFGWFVLALDVLHSLGTVNLVDDLLVRGRD